MQSSPNVLHREIVFPELLLWFKTHSDDLHTAVQEDTLETLCWSCAGHSALLCKQKINTTNEQQFLDHLSSSREIGTQVDGTEAKRIAWRSRKFHFF